MCSAFSLTAFGSKVPSGVVADSLKLTTAFERLMRPERASGLHVRYLIVNTTRNLARPLIIWSYASAAFSSG